MNSPVGMLWQVNFSRTTLTARELSLQQEVREFVRSALPAGSYEEGLGMQGEWDRDFSALLASRGWVGMTLPTQYGGGGMTFVERFVVTEELLRVGAPVAFHWVADRQSGPIINRYGNDEQRSRFLPGICAGQLAFAIGMSEAGSGSDLASISTSATRVDGGWRLNGTKLWTSHGHRCDWLVVLARSSRGERRQDGLSQFLVDRRSPGVHARPIVLIDGTEDFSEVHLDNVFVPDADVLGAIDSGWEQNTAELAFERGGPDRWLSTVGLFAGWLAQAERNDRSARFAAETVATLRALRNLSLSVARTIDAGGMPSDEAALVKEYGTRFEQQIALDIERLYDRPVALDSADPFERMLARALLVAPSFTIRGGTTEVLRTVVARQLVSPGRQTHRRWEGVEPALIEAVQRMFHENQEAGPASPSDDGRSPAELWAAIESTGLHLVAVPEEAGGSGGTALEFSAILREAAMSAPLAPMAETNVAAWVLASAGLEIPAGTLAFAVAPEAVVFDGESVTGAVAGVPWAADVDTVVLLVPAEDARWHVCVIAQASLESVRGVGLGGEPRADLSLRAARPQQHAVIEADVLRDARDRERLFRTAQIAGALTRIAAMTTDFARTREQFGKPISSFQAVQQHLVSLAQWDALMTMAVEEAAAALTREAPGDQVRDQVRDAIAAAAIMASRVVGPAVLAAHQVHGAIGLTLEYPLQRFTRRARAWTAAAASDVDVVRWGAALLEASAEEMYEAIAPRE